MADQMKVLVICGSLRKGSYNAALTRALPALALPEMKLITAPPIGSFPLYNADVQDASGFPGPAEDLAAAIRDADGVLFVSPEYNWSMPGVLKNAIDWVSRMKEQPFKEKPVAGLDAEVRKEGVVLRWSTGSAQEPAALAIRLDRKLLTPVAVKPAQGPLVPPAEPMEMKLLVAASGQAGRGPDRA